MHGIRASVVVALVLGVGVLVGPAHAVTVGPSGDLTHFDASGYVHPGDVEDPRVNTVDIVGGGGCLLDPTACDLPALAVGREYHAIITDSGHGYWDCAVSDQIDCSWTYPSPTKREYVFTYNGDEQTLTPYFASAKLAIAKQRAGARSWQVTCRATRDDQRYSDARVVMQWRTARRPAWHKLATATTNHEGIARVRTLWPRSHGSVRCVTAGDWHTDTATSRQVSVHRR